MTSLRSGRSKTVLLRSSVRSPSASCAVVSKASNAVVRLLTGVSLYWKAYWKSGSRPNGAFKVRLLIRRSSAGRAIAEATNVKTVM